MAPALSFSRTWLSRVSRSFAPSIGQLGEPLETPVGLAYLLCRVVDTVEDAVDLSGARRTLLFSGFREALASSDAVPEFAEECKRSFRGRDGDDAELMAEVTELFGHYYDLDLSQRRAMAPWIHEMAEGMEKTVLRFAKGGGRLLVLEDRADLQTYCHFVAGTVGGLLTDLFVLHESDIDVADELRMRAESFGQGLQMVNIAKDLATDHERGWQFLPRSLCQGFAPADLLVPTAQEAALMAHSGLCDWAAEELQVALEYTLFLPGDAAARRFCALPLLLARATLREVRNNPRVLDPNDDVKVPREETMGLISFVAGRVGDDVALRDLYADLGTDAQAWQSAGP